jgi:UDP-N-acetylmuramoyl-tripeptide--D-alanyl-D-alanine ligase
MQENMEPVTIREVLEATGGKLLGDQTNLEQLVSGIDTDSRDIHEGSLFLPLLGERFDGHAFIEDALTSGAMGAFTVRERNRYAQGKYYIQVKNTQKALRDLVKYYKKKFQIPFIAVTGSVGKTTTKDMIAAVLGAKYKVLKTEGNYNNEIGLPLTLLRLDPSHHCAVLEMGMSGFGEIQYLSEIVEPDVAVISNIGDAHIEYLESRENILKAKCEVFSFMKPNAAVVLNGDDPLLRTLDGQHPFQMLWCGKGEQNDFHASEIKSDGRENTFCRIRTPHAEWNAEIPALGDYMIYPVLMATAVAQTFGLTTEEISRGIADFSPTKMRMNVLHQANEVTILDDAYNANPQSMRAAVEVLTQTKGEYKIAILGDMFELGPLAPVLHRGVGEYLGKKGVDCLVAVGEMAKEIHTAALAEGISRSFYFESKEEALPVLNTLLRPGCTILVKASRGMAFEAIVKKLKELTAV